MCEAGALHSVLRSASEKGVLRSGAPSAGFRVTDRDREIVRWVGRLRMVTAAQISERFELGRAVSYARLSGLVRLGLLEHTRVFHATPGVYTASRAGLATVELALPPARIDLRTYEHDLELSSLVVELEREFGSDRLTTEREMRGADTAVGGTVHERPRFAVPLIGGRGQLQLTPARHRRLHFPDCAIASADGNGAILAIELERTAKGRARLRGILTAYVAARHIGQVRYYAVTERVRKLLAAEVEQVGARDLISVMGRAASEGTARVA
jgi:hypothetical protein